MLIIDYSQASDYRKFMQSDCMKKESLLMQCDHIGRTAWKGGHIYRVYANEWFSRASGAYALHGDKIAILNILIWIKFWDV